MSDIKWIKITTNMFENEKIRLIDAMPERDTIHYVWVRLLVQAGKTNANGFIFLNENIPYSEEMLSTIFCRPLDSIRLALKTLSDFEMIEVAPNNIIKILNWDKHQNIEGMERVRAQGRKRAIEKPKKENSQPLAVSCECSKVEKLKNEWKSCGINTEMCKHKFSNFEVWNESSERAKDTAIAYYNDFEEVRGGRKNSILFCGQVGSGKTHLSVALAINFLKQKARVVYMPYRDVITKIKQNMLDTEYYCKMISNYQICEVLLIDDLFKGKINESDINIIFEIINYRYLNFLPIIVSSEFSIDRLLAFDEAIGSRLYEMCKDYVVEIEKDINNNYRLK